MKSWGIGSRFTDRHTEAEPSKSGAIGLISSALGRSRGEDISDLAQMKMAVRVEREGQISYDYHTTLNVLRADAKESFTQSKLATVVSRRFYIADACFLVGFEGTDKTLLENINLSLIKPKWPLFLGRKSFPASAPIALTNQTINRPLLEVMKVYPWQGREDDPQPENLRLIYECGPNEGEPRIDVPISFVPRRFRARYVTTDFISSKILQSEV